MSEVVKCSLELPPGTDEKLIRISSRVAEIIAQIRELDHEWSVLAAASWVLGGDTPDAAGNQSPGGYPWREDPGTLIASYTGRPSKRNALDYYNWFLQCFSRAPDRIEYRAKIGWAAIFLEKGEEIMVTSCLNQCGGGRSFEVQKIQKAFDSVPDPKWFESGTAARTK